MHPVDPVLTPVAIQSNTTETLPALGLGGRILGMDPDGPSKYTAATAVLADQARSREVAPEPAPELVHAGHESRISVDDAGERILNGTPAERGEEPRSALEVIVRLATTVNSSVESGR